MTRDEIIRMALESGCNSLNVPNVGIVLRYNDMRVTNLLERFAALVAAAEREECAKVCDANAHSWPYPSHGNAAAKLCAQAIRARGEKGQS